MLAATCALALACAAVAAAGNGGIAPPEPHSPNAERINDTYWVILALAAVVFLLVEGALVTFVFRFRGRGRRREVEGPQIHGATRLEIIWTAVPVLLLTGVLGFIFYKLPGIQDVPEARAGQQRLNITVNAHQFYWQFNYPDGTVSIDELRVPINRVVTLDIESHDVVHSWWIPEFSGKFDAVPGETNHTWFKVDRAGTYRGQCGEFCGIFHAVMNARVVATTEQEFQSWLDRRTAATLGRDEWVGACAKCHGLGAKGDYGPPLTGNPILTNRRSLEQIITRGQGKMPPVSRGWTDAQIDALYRYVRENVYEGGADAAEG